jgi:hypothetical protein
VEVLKIGTEELEVLLEIESLCIFLSSKQKNDFRSSVCGKVNCVRYEDITEDDFELAFETAREILRERGRAVLNRR